LEEGLFFYDSPRAGHVLKHPTINIDLVGRVLWRVVHRKIDAFNLNSPTYFSEGVC
jgi:hypothetical protein